MMKKLILMIVIATLIFGACSAAPAASDAAKTDSGLVKGAFTEEDLVFVLDGKPFPLNTDAAPLLTAFGGEYETTTAPSCVYEGEDKQFDFAFASVFTYPTDGKDLIDEIDIYGGDYQTTKGIRLGSGKEEVLAQYGKGEDKGDMIVYTLSGDPKDLKSPQLFFDIEDNKVTGISYYAASNVAE